MLVYQRVEGMLRLHSRAQLLFGELHTKTLAGFDSDNTTWHSSDVMVLRSFGGAAQSIRACQPAVPRRFLSWTSVIPLAFLIWKEVEKIPGTEISGTLCSYTIDGRSWSLMAFQAHFKLQLLGRFMVSDMFQDETRLTGYLKIPNKWGVFYWP